MSSLFALEDNPIRKTNKMNVESFKTNGGFFQEDASSNKVFSFYVRNVPTNKNNLDNSNDHNYC